MSSRLRTVLVWLAALALPNFVYVLVPPWPGDFATFATVRGAGPNPIQFGIMMAVKGLVVVTPAGIAFGWGMERMWRHILLYVLLIVCFAAAVGFVAGPEVGGWSYLSVLTVPVVYGCLAGGLIGQTVRRRTGPSHQSS